MDESTLTPLSESPRLGLLFQSFYDLIPVAFFMIGSIILLRRLYNKMVKADYALLAGGTVMVSGAGILKALHKFLIAVADIDYVILDKQFSPTQSLGFFLMFLSLVLMFTAFNKKATKVRSFAFPVLLFPLFATIYESSISFIIIMVVGALGTLAMLIYMGARTKSRLSILFYAIAIVSMLAMGYLSTKRYYEYAWIAISVNVIYQGSYFLGTLFLDRKGLAKDDIFYKE